MKERLKKEETGFTQVVNTVLCDPRLSAKAKGVYAYLYSKPDDWDFSSERIAKDFKDGHRAIQTSLQELESAGYLERKRLNTGKVEYFMKLKPKVQNRRLRKPQTAETADISNKENKLTKKETNIYVGEASSQDVFSFSQELEKLQNSKRKVDKIVAHYWIRKGYRFPNREQFRAQLGEALKYAVPLKGYTGEELDRVFDRCARDALERGFEWKLSTAVKTAPDVLNKTSP